MAPAELARVFPLHSPTPHPPAASGTPRAPGRCGRGRRLTQWRAAPVAPFRPAPAPRRRRRCRRRRLCWGRAATTRPPGGGFAQRRAPPAAASPPAGRVCVGRARLCTVTRAGGCTFIRAYFPADRHAASLRAAAKGRLRTPRLGRRRGVPHLESLVVAAPRSLIRLQPQPLRGLVAPKRALVQACGGQRFVEGFGLKLSNPTRPRRGARGLRAAAANARSPSGPPPLSRRAATSRSSECLPVRSVGLAGRSRSIWKALATPSTAALLNHSAMAAIDN
jgi:hypothetical protein